MQKFKIQNKIEDIEWFTNPLCLPPRGSHRGYLERELVKSCDQRHNFFNNRIASKWNSSPDDIASAKSINISKTS